MDAIKQVEKAAKAEHAAEQSRERQETRWRAAWWDTTLAIAEPTAQLDITAALKAAQDELGCSRDYLSKRRRVGKIIRTVLEGGESDLETVHTLPPRLSLAWVQDLKRDADGMLDALTKAQEDELSLRGFIAQYGGVAMSTSRFTPSPNGHSAETPNRQTSVQDQIAAARAAIEDPEIGREIMRNPKTASAATRASREAAVQEHEARTRDRALADPASARQAQEDQAQVARMMARVNLESAIHHAKRDGIVALGCWAEIQGLSSDVDRDLILDAVDEALNPFMALKDALKNNSSIDAELLAFLAEEGNE